MSCGCNNCTTCGQSPCACNRRSPGCAPVPFVPTPFYGAQGTCCPEQHCNPQLIPAYAGVKVSDSFNMPGCGQSAMVSVPNLIGLPVGAYLWNVGVGYLKVVAVNLLDGTVLLQNDCTAGNIPPGSTVAACTTFVVTDTPPNAGTSPGQAGVFVAIDFTAPANGTCLVITVTAVTGLAVGKNVAIGSGTYRINSIPSATTLEICNDGSGITPGSPVIAKNGSGQYQYPITLIDVNACTNPAVEVGQLVICKDGIQQPLTAAAAGMVPVSQDGLNNFKSMFLDVPTRTCATILCCLTLVPGTLVYVVEVSTSAGFAIGDVLQIGTRTDRFTVNAILDATHIQVTVDTNPAVLETIPVATSICIVDCCEINATAIFCDPLQVVGDIPLTFYIVVPTPLTDGYYETTLDLALRTVDLAALGICHTADYAVVAHVSVARLTDYAVDFTELAYIYHEIELRWDNGAFPVVRTCGKIVDSDTINEDRAAYGPPEFPVPVPPNAPLFAQLLSAGPRFPMTYKQQDVEAMALLGGNDASTLQLFYRTMIGDANAPTDIFEVRFMVSGWLEIRRSQ